MLTWPSKDPDEAVLYGIDFSERVADGVTVSSATWSLSPAGLTASTQTTSGAIAQLKLAGGALGDAYLVNCRATMSDGQILEETARLEILAR